jgi:uracil-DNA glycosylase family 4
MGAQERVTENSVTKGLDQVILGCTRCPLCDFAVNQEQGKMLGFGVSGEFMIVGQNPSEIRRVKLYAMSPDGVENSPASYLWKVLGDVEFPIEKTYITNFLKCSTPGNRLPYREEAEACFNTWLAQEIYLCKPTTIICLGNLSYNLVSERLNLFINIDIKEVYHHSFIARTPNKFEEWKNQWLNIKNGR